MLESLRVKNYRSCEDTHLRLGSPVVALLGKNGVGKTNLLHAIKLCAELCLGGTEPTLAMRARNPDLPIEFFLSFHVDASRYEYSIKNAGEFPSYLEESLTRDGTPLLLREGESVFIHPGSGQRELRSNARASALSIVRSMLPDGDELRAELRPVVSFLEGVRYYPLIRDFQEHSARIEIPFIEGSDYRAWKGAGPHSPIVPTVQLQLLDMWLLHRPKFDELQFLLGEQGLGLIDQIKILQFPPPAADGKASGNMNYWIQFEPASGLAGAGQSFRYNGLSAGTWRILSMLTSLLYDENSCMLLEQPEDSIHPGILEKLIDVFETYSHRTQLICTTHSPRVIDLVGGPRVRLVAAVDGETVVTELGEGELTAAQRYMQDEGSLSDFLGLL